MYENILFNNLCSYFNTNNLITKNQCGFLPGDFTTNQLLFLVNTIHEAFEKRNSLEVWIVFLGITKRYIRSFIKALWNYLHNRQTGVVQIVSFSDYSIIESGVPLGSVLSHPLFFVFLNDLERNIKSNINFFCWRHHVFLNCERSCSICGRPGPWPGTINGKWNSTEVIIFCKNINPTPKTLYSIIMLLPKWRSKTLRTYTWLIIMLWKTPKWKGYQGKEEFGTNQTSFEIYTPQNTRSSV